MRPPLDVVLPVHGAAGDLARCLRSVLTHTRLGEDRLLIVVDGPQESEVESALAVLAGLPEGHVLVLRQADRGGFAAAVNRGLALSSRDAVLLNSDTQVTARWLDKLAAAAGCRSNVGTVTPLSNNATICSLPRTLADNELPAGHDVDSFAELVERVSAHEYPTLPTGVGFCLLVRREMLERVGTLDARRFGSGYGEETDLCMRGRTAGFVHLLDDATFVWHRGQGSFGAGRTARVRRAHWRMRWLHPAYLPAVADFMRRDPLAAVRRQVTEALAVEALGAVRARRPRARRAPAAVRPRRVTHVVHGWPPFAHGGTELYAAWLARRQSADRRVAVYARVADSSRAGGDARELQDGAVRVRLQVNNLVQRDPLSRNAIHDRVLRRDFARFLDEERPELIHVHHLAGHAATMIGEARRRGLPVLYQVQDWWSPCARVNLLHRDGQLCGGPAAGKCSACLPLTALPGSWLWNRLLYLARWAATHRALAHSDLLLFGSQFALESYGRLDWLPRGVPARVLGYGVDLADMVAAPPRVKPPSPPVRFGFVGSLLPHKGVQVAMEAFAGIDPRRAVFEVWGDPSPVPDLAAGLEGGAASAVRWRGTFAESDKARVLGDMDALVVPSLGLESFGLLPREALHLGVPVLASRSGALAELPLDGECGEHFSPGDVAALRRLLERWIDRLLAEHPPCEPIPAKGADEHADEIAALYTEVLARRGRG